MFNKSFMSYKRKELTPDITPLIDVVFLLLIFFMVSVNFDKMGAITLELPQSQVAVEQRSLESISLVIDKEKNLKIKIEENGEVIFQDILLENLERELTLKIGGAESKNIGIIADRDITHGDIVDVMTIIKNSGASGIDIEMIIKK